MVGSSRWGIMLGDGMLVPDSWESRSQAEVVLGEIRGHGYEDAILVEWKQVDWEVQK